MSRFQIHDDLTAPEGSVPVLRGALATGGQLPNFLGVLGGAPAALRAGSTARDAHRAVAKGFLDRGFHLGHVTGHSIGMTMIEFPKIGEGFETELEANMVFSMHPHAIGADGRECLYMQDTWLVTPGGGEPLAGLELKIYQ